MPQSPDGDPKPKKKLFTPTGYGEQQPQAIEQQDIFQGCRKIESVFRVMEQFGWVMRNEDGIYRRSDQGDQPDPLATAVARAFVDLKTAYDRNFKIYYADHPEDFTGLQFALDRSKIEQILDQHQVPENNGLKKAMRFLASGQNLRSASPDQSEPVMRALETGPFNRAVIYGKKLEGQPFLNWYQRNEDQIQTLDPSARHQLESRYKELSSTAKATESREAYDQWHKQRREAIIPKSRALEAYMVDEGAYQEKMSELESKKEQRADRKKAGKHDAIMNPHGEEVFSLGQEAWYALQKIAGPDSKQYVGFNKFDLGDKKASVCFSRTMSLSSETGKDIIINIVTGARKTRGDQFKEDQTGQETWSENPNQPNINTFLEQVGGVRLAGTLPEGFSRDNAANLKTELVAAKKRLALFEAEVAKGLGLSVRITEDINNIISKLEHDFQV